VLRAQTNLFLLSTSGYMGRPGRRPAPNSRRYSNDAADSDWRSLLGRKILGPIWNWQPVDLFPVLCHPKPNEIRDSDLPADHSETLGREKTPCGGPSRRAKVIGQRPKGDPTRNFITDTRGAG
jgi:hypothetical protein